MYNTSEFSPIRVSTEEMQRVQAIVSEIAVYDMILFALKSCSERVVATCKGRSPEQINNACLDYLSGAASVLAYSANVTQNVSPATALAYAGAYQRLASLIRFSVAVRGIVGVRIEMQQCAEAVQRLRRQLPQGFGTGAAMAVAVAPSGVIPLET